MKHLTLIGVAAVGKTTMGRIISENLNLNFKDVYLETVSEYGNNVDELIAKFGNETWSNLLWQKYEELLKSKNRTLIVVTPRILNYDKFWMYTKTYSISIHIKSSPLIVLYRNLNRMHPENDFNIKITSKMKSDYYKYYRWRMSQCKNSDYTFKMKNNLNIDLYNLSKLILRINKTAN